MSLRFFIFLLFGAVAVPSKAVEIHGHRGSRGTHPEHTLPAFQEAVAAGAYALELDLQLTGDGVPVVWHDPVLRPENCKTKDADFSGVALLQLQAADLKRFDCGSVQAEGFNTQQTVPGAEILTLERFLKWVRQNHVRQKLTIEFKTDSSPPPDVESFVRTVFGLVSQFHLKGQVTVQSFTPAVLKQAALADPGVPRALLTENEPRFCIEAARHQASMAFPDYASVNEETLQECLKRGIPVIPYTANEPMEWRRLIQLGVRGIITDYPRALRQFLASLSP